MKRFNEKVILITGASSGIGRALALAFAQEGAKVVATARRVDRLQALENEIEAKGAQALSLACDVTCEGDLERVVDATRKKFGGIDVVVANAGFGVVGKIEQLHLEDYRRQFETNVFGMLRTIFATFEELKKTKGTLVLMGSVSGHIGAPEATPYCMSKFAVRALAESLYAELAPLGIAVVLISPGFVHSEIYQVNNRGVFDPRQKNPVPTWLKMPTEKAARQILAAIHKKKKEKIITLHGKFLVFAKRYFPGLVTWFFKKARTFSE